MKSKKIMLKSLLTFVVAISMFMSFGKVEAQAEEKSVLDLKPGDRLNPGDVITHDGKISMFVVYGDVASDNIALDESPVIIKDRYLSQCYNGCEIINMTVEYVWENGDDASVQMYATLIDANCEHEWKVVEEEGYDYHMVECKKCNSIYSDLHTYENDACIECETGSLVEVTVEEEVAVVEPVVEEEASVEEVSVEETIIEESVVEEELPVEESVVEETESKGMPVGAIVGVGVVAAVGLYIGMKKNKK